MNGNGWMNQIPHIQSNPFWTCYGTGKNNNPLPITARSSEPGTDPTHHNLPANNPSFSASRSELHGRFLLTYDELTSAPEEDVDAETSVLFVSSQEDHTRDELVDEKFKEQIDSLVIKHGHKNGCFQQLPFGVFQKLSIFLDYESLMMSRLVCKSWNSSVSSTGSFLSRTTFCLQSCDLTLVKVCRSTEVKWRNVKCSFIPCVEADTTKGYHKQYFVNKLLPNSSSFLVTSVTTIILQAFEIPKMNFLKWLSSCENLKCLELIKCSLMVSKTSWTKDSLERAARSLKSVSMVNMSLASVVDFGMLILIHTKHLLSLKISQKGIESTKDESGSGISRLRIKSLEDGVASMLKDTVTKNRRSLRHIQYTFESFQNPMIHLKIISNVGHLGLDLHTFSFIVLSPTEVLLEASVEFLQNLKQHVRNILIASPAIQSLRVPLISLNFSDIEDLVWDFPITLKSVEAQFIVPFRMTSLSPNVLRERCVLKRLTLRGRSLKTDSEWADLYKCIPWLTKLQIYSTDVSDEVVQSIMKHFTALTELKLMTVKVLTDSGITGVQHSNKQLGGHRKSFQDMPELVVLVIHGDYYLTDITMQLGFRNPKLESLSITGSPLDITAAGLNCLATNCPELQTIILQVKRPTPETNPEATTVHYADILRSKLPRLKVKDTRIALK